MTDKRDDRAARFAAEHKELFERLMTMDFAAIEKRVLAAIGKGGDPHAEAYAGAFDVPVAEVTTDQRRIGKAINFALLYDLRRSPDRSDISELLRRGLTMTGRKPTSTTPFQFPKARS